MLEQRLRWDFQEEVGNWAQQTFPAATNHSIVSHIKKEIKELAAAIKKNDKKGIAEGCADIYALLLHLAHRERFDLFIEGRNKMEINYKRKWGKPDKNGVVEHVR